MTVVQGGRDTGVAEVLERHRKGTRFADVLATTDHKVVGHLYLATSFTLFLVAGLMAMVMRAELAGPGLQVVGDQRYNELFTIHGTIMLLLFATPLFAGFANVIVPLQIGAPDVAFPRLNTLSYYLFVLGAAMVLFGFLVPGGAAAFGWFAYSPLTSGTYSPGRGGDLWVMGLVLSGFGTIFTAVNMVATIIAMRAPGMVMFRMPIFTWNVLLTSVMVLVAFPVLAAALLALEADRRLGAHVYDAQHGGALLWQHLFWFFGHPEVYIVALPFFGIVTEILPVFSRKPIFGYLALVAATIAITGLSMTVWAHHMFATGQVLLPFFSFMSFMIAVPTGIKFFNWVGTVWKGQLSFETPMLWALGFLVTFLFGGLTGVILASPPMDFHLTDSYFVVAHFHYVLFGTVVFAMFGGFYFWWPKMTGKRLDETWGRIHFWSLFAGFHTTFLVQHWLGAEGMPRRVADYADGFGTLNLVSSIGSFVLGASTFAFLWNIWRTHRHGEHVGVDDPWGFGGSLEWATSCPPPRHNFTAMPRIRSMRPAFDLHYPPKLPPREAEPAPPPVEHARPTAASPASSSWPRRPLRRGSRRR
ncbi:cytochrome c oxidase subunit I [Actinomadura sp. NEAU-AAG7]|uniref:aa3-type cytochrome oxidase subunit I n=1 Tax=Actinomadura sp. NEAU-AAG7 TaxID=2839640 RepID=UPI001BE4147A|nr:cytochrome c oxidase subunit I [Actinomadura sp. NEAU-AAG7]MBT2209987.1 cytochrome c oxidase subunit I [Actinomadura sp. NEAU-AAG7]